MNNGNLLNNLLSFSGTPGVNAGTGKHSPAKTRVDVNEHFRDALAQARPEVAAQKPASRKPAVAANEVRQSADAHNAKSSSATHREREPLRNDVARKTAPGDTHTKSRQGEPASGEGKSVKRESDSGGTATAADNGSDASTQPTDQPTTDTGLLQSSEANSALGGEVGDALGSELLESGLLEDDLPGSDLLESDTLLAMNPEALLAGTIPLTPLAAEVSTAELAGLDTDGALFIAVSGTQTTPGLSVGVASEQSVTIASALSAAGSNNSASNNVLQISDEANESAETIGEIAIDGTGDNPDFLLLSGKAALGKLMDASATNEKALDPAKPIITPTTLTEPLARLTEAQSPAARSFVVQTGVPVSVGQPQWSQAVGEKVLWLAAQNVSSAEIRLDPPDLGQLHVKVSVNQDQATVSFTSPHPMVREALDQQLNRLREMFSEQGLNLVNVDVSDRSSPQQDENAGQGKHAAASTENEDEVTAGVMTSIVSSRLVDHYA